MDKKLIAPCSSGGWNACQVKGIWQSELHCSPNPKSSRLQKFFVRYGKHFGYVEKPSKLFKNPRFLLKIDGNVEDSIELIIGLMVDPIVKFITLTSRRRQKLNFLKSKNMKTFSGANLRIYPAPDDKCHLQSNYIMNYIDVVPKIGTKETCFPGILEFVERVTLTPGSYILVPSIKTNLRRLAFLIRVFSQSEGVTLTAL